MPKCHNATKPLLCVVLLRSFLEDFLLAIFPILFSIGVIALILEIPFWLITGKGILNNVCDGMLLEVLEFLED